MSDVLERGQELEECAACAGWVWTLLKAIDDTPNLEWVSFSFREIAGRAVNHLQFSYLCHMGRVTYTVPTSQINCMDLDAQMVILARYFGLRQGTKLWGKECRFCKGRREMYVDNVLMDITR